MARLTVEKYFMHKQKTTPLAVENTGSPKEHFPDEYLIDL
jgi:hypothetical protein